MVHLPKNTLKELYEACKELQESMAVSSLTVEQVSQRASAEHRKLLSGEMQMLCEHIHAIEKALSSIPIGDQFEHFLQNVSLDQRMEMLDVFFDIQDMAHYSRLENNGNVPLYQMHFLACYWRVTQTSFRSRSLLNAATQEFLKESAAQKYGKLRKPVHDSCCSISSTIGK